MRENSSGQCLVILTYLDRPTNKQWKKVCVRQEMRAVLFYLPYFHLQTQKKLFFSLEMVKQRSIKED